MLEKAHKLTPASPQILWHYAAALAKSGDRKAALAKLEGLIDSKIEFAERQQTVQLVDNLKRQGL